MESSKFVISYYLCKHSRNTETSSQILEKMLIKNKFGHKWIFDPELSKSEETGISNFIHREGKRMFCGLCRMTNTPQQSNNSKAKSSKAISLEPRKSETISTKQGT